MPGVGEVKTGSKNLTRFDMASYAPKRVSPQVHSCECRLAKKDGLRSKATAFAADDGPNIADSLDNDPLGF